MTSPCIFCPLLGFAGRALLPACRLCGSAAQIATQTVDCSVYRATNLPFYVLKYLIELARPRGVEPLTPRSVVWCSIQLSYGRLPRVGPAMRGGHNYSTAVPEGKAHRRARGGCRLLPKPHRTDEPRCNSGARDRRGRSGNPPIDHLARRTASAR